MNTPFCIFQNEDGESHNATLLNLKRNGKGQVQWSRIEQAFDARLVERVPEGIPYIHQDTGLTEHIFKQNETYIVTVSGRRSRPSFQSCGFGDESGSFSVVAAKPAHSLYVFKSLETISWKKEDQSPLEALSTKSTILPTLNEIFTYF